MPMLAQSAVILVALIHFYFLILEMFFWTKPFGRKTFGLAPGFAAQSKTLAANQGLYNGFLAVGLLLGVFFGASGAVLTYFCLGCVVVAGIFGTFTVSSKIFVLQALPALVALLLLGMFSGY